MSTPSSTTNPLYEPDASVEATNLPQQGSTPSSLTLPRHRSSASPKIDGLHSDETIENYAYSPGKGSGEESSIFRTRSLGREDSITESPAIKGTPGVPLLAGSSPLIAESPVPLGPSPALERSGTPLLRVLSQHSDLSPKIRDRDDTRLVQTARNHYPSTAAPALGKRMSEAISAPNTARDFPSPVHMQRSITFANENAMIIGASLPQPPPAIHSGVATPGIRRDARPLAPHVPAAQSFFDYLGAELHPGPSYSTADTVWGQTERDRVYNALMAVPFQLERLLWLGMTVCLDSFLAVFTVLPLRVIGAVGTILLGMLRSMTGRRKRPGPVIRGDHIYDLLCAAMFATVVVFLWKLKAGSIYYWVKDLTQEFLKLSVLLTALELSDKVSLKILI